MIKTAFTNKFSLRSKLIFYVIIPLGMVLMISGFLSLHVLETWTEERMQEEIQLVARAISLPLSRAFEQGYDNTLNKALQSAFSIGRVYGAYLYDSGGRRIAAVGREQSPPPSSHLSELAQAGDHTGEYGEIGGRGVYSYFVPLTDSGGRISGLLQVTRRASDFENNFRNFRVQALTIFALGFLVVTAVVLYGHHGAIGRHLGGIVKSMEKVQRGKRHHRANLDGPRELAALASSLNRMLDSIEDAEEELRTRRREQMRLHEKLRQAEKLAAIGQLAAGVAHKLGTPLSVIYGKAQRAMRLPQAPENLRSALKDIRAEVQRMERIVHQLLDFGRANKLQLRNVPANRLVESAVNCVNENLDGKSVTLEVGGARPAPVLNVDPLRIEQALINLLQNAIQASPEGHVKVSWFQQGEQAGLVVEDDGPGIAEGLRNRLFEPFFTTKRVGEGTGLGLAVVHGIVQEHGGRIEVEKSPRGGALFRIALAERRCNEDPAGAEEQPGTGGGG